MQGLRVSILQIAVIVVGVGSLLLSMVLGFGVMDYVVKNYVRGIMRLIPGKPLWKAWENIPVDIFMNMYLFNITNAERLNQGEKPIMKEIGPYVYLLKFNKIDITMNETEDTVRYRELRKYFFQPELSAGSETDEATVINIFYAVFAHKANKMTQVGAVLEALDEMLSGKGEKLYKTGTVREIIFDGVSIQNFVDVLDELALAPLPEAYQDGKFALFKGKNGSDSGFFEVRTGVRTSENFTRIVSVNGKTKMDKWKGDNCNDINGTNAQMYQPFQEPGITKLQAYVPDLCRTITLKYVRPEVVKGINVARHYLEDFLTPEENPANWCYCPYDDIKQCNITGLAYMEPCLDAPMIFSKPHFYHVHPSVLDMVEGLSPNEELHETRIDFFPFTGSGVQAKFRLQLSIELINYKDMPGFSNVSRAIVPLMWFEQSVILGDEKRGFLVAFDTYQSVWPVIKYLWMLISLAIIGFGGFLFYKSRQAGNSNNTVDILNVDSVTPFSSDNMDKQLAFVFSNPQMKY